jgi:hypothetical protein
MGYKVVRLTGVKLNSGVGAGLNSRVNGRDLRGLSIDAHNFQRISYNEGFGGAGCQRSNGEDRLTAISGLDKCNGLGRNLGLDSKIKKGKEELLGKACAEQGFNLKVLRPGPGWDVGRQQSSG